MKLLLWLLPVQQLSFCTKLNAFSPSYKDHPIFQTLQNDPIEPAPSRTSSSQQDNAPRMLWTRRKTLHGLATTFCVVLASNSAARAEPKVLDHEGTLEQEREQHITRMLQTIPTFAIVDDAGVPYMVVGEDAKVTGYFFTSYNEADRILQLARQSANDIEDNNPWKQARISTVPLDTAVGITLKSRGGNLRNYFLVAASAAAIEDALDITGQEDLAESKVPLFYSADRPELYFERSQIPKGRGPVQVTELFAILQQMASSDDLRDFRIVPPKDSAKKAKECERKSGSSPPLVLGKSNIVL